MLAKLLTSSEHLAIPSISELFLLPADSRSSSEVEEEVVVLSFTSSSAVLFLFNIYKLR